MTTSLRLTIIFFILAAALAPALLISWHSANVANEVQAAPAVVVPPVVPAGFKTAPWEGVSKKRVEAAPPAPSTTPAAATTPDPKQTQPAAPATPAPAGPTVLVELFTSEGCSSCPAADKVLADLAAAAPADGNVFFLAYHVDYWDKLGWKDRFASAAFTERQRAYAKAFDTDSVYTPQTIVNGKLGFVGSDRPKTEEAIRAAKLDKPAATLTATHSELKPDQTVKVEIKLTALDGQKLPPDIKLYAALIENHLTTQVKRGENEGRTLKHERVVRAVAEAKPAADSSAVTLELKSPADLVPANAAIVVFAQDPKAMRIFTASESHTAAAAPNQPRTK